MIAFNEKHRDREMAVGQDLFVGAEKRGPLSGSRTGPREKDEDVSRGGIDRAGVSSSRCLVRSPAAAWTIDVERGSLDQRDASGGGGLSEHHRAGGARVRCRWRQLSALSDRADADGFAFAFEEATHRKAPAFLPVPSSRPR